ncbi:MAG: hypothetical protein CL675_07100 [Bdellovibrionaceae bacterium]|nr:hypothetical protein [Pseudobdellovibrionaceae bacterium]
MRIWVGLLVLLGFMGCSSSPSASCQKACTNRYRKNHQLNCKAMCDRYNFRVQNQGQAADIGKHCS